MSIYNRNYVITYMTIPLVISVLFSILILVNILLINNILIKISLN